MANTGVQKPMTRTARKKLDKQNRVPIHARIIQQLKEDHCRAHLERRLLSNTEELPHQCGIAYEKRQEYYELFRNKDAPLVSTLEKMRDDTKRRMVVRELFRCHEAAGYEATGETSLWEVGYGEPEDMAEALTIKFKSKWFVEIAELLNDRKAQRRFLEMNLKPHLKGVTPINRIKWLRQIINDNVRPIYDETGWYKTGLLRMRAVYYIFACRKACGLGPSDDPTEPMTCEGPEEAQKIHRFLMEQPMSFFEDDDFTSPVILQISIEFAEAGGKVKVPKGKAEFGAEAHKNDDSDPAKREDYGDEYERAVNEVMESGDNEIYGANGPPFVLPHRPRAYTFGDDNHIAPNPLLHESEGNWCITPEPVPCDRNGRVMG